MNNASPRRFPLPTSFPVHGGGLAPINVLDVSFEDDDSSRGGAAVAASGGQALEGRSLSAGSFTSPFSHAENPARDDCAGFFIALGVWVPVGIVTWALLITAYLAFL